MKSNFGWVWLLQILTGASKVHCDQPFNWLEFNLKTHMCIPVRINWQLENLPHTALSTWEASRNLTDIASKWDWDFFHFLPTQFHDMRGSLNFLSVQNCSQNFSLISCVSVQQFQSWVKVSGFISATDIKKLPAVVAKKIQQRWNSIFAPFR